MNKMWRHLEAQMMVLTLQTIRWMLLSLGAAGLFALPAWASNYPVSGRWAYLQPEKPMDCSRPPYMEFSGNRRFDVGGGSVPDYRNISVEPGGTGEYHVVDLFFTGQIRGQVRYTLRLVGPARLELRLEPSGKTVMLQRCQ
jgi:hypothetical protein